MMPALRSRGAVALRKLARTAARAVGARRELVEEISRQRPTVPNRAQLWTSISPKASWIAGLVGNCRAREDAGIAFYECF